MSEQLTSSPENPSDPVEVTILLPAYNEEEALPGVLEEVRSVMDQWGGRYEILVVDDCSSDRTVELAQAGGARVVRHGARRGSGAGRRTGVLEARGEIIVMLDADGTYDPPSIPKMLEYFPVYDQVNGARTSEQGTHKAIRTVAKEIIRHLAQYLSGSAIPDLNTGLKAFKRDVMKRYLWVLPDGFSCVTTMTLAFLCNGHPVKYVPTPYRKRSGGHSKFHPIKDTANYLNTVVRMSTYFKPLRVFGPLSLILIVSGILLGLYNLNRPGNPTLEESDIILICTGLMMGAIGLLADLIVATRRA
jgi:glycosyltransferase involved in cell wall biosynthesis